MDEAVVRYVSGVRQVCAHGRTSSPACAEVQLEQAAEFADAIRQHLAAYRYALPKHSALLYVGKMHCIMNFHAPLCTIAEKKAILGNFTRSGGASGRDRATEVAR